MIVAADPRQNRLLAALPDAEWERLLPHLERVEMPLSKVLYESGDRLAHVYFPTNSIVSLLYVMENGSSAEIAVVGFEGIVGISLFMGGNSTPSRAVVQSAGQGFRLKANLLMEEFNTKFKKDGNKDIPFGNILFKNLNSLLRFNVKKV